MSSEKKKDMDEFFSKAEEVVKYFSSGRRFAEELLRENERLRYKVMHLEQAIAEAASRVGGGSPEDVAEENRNLKEQLEEIRKNFEELNKENEGFRNRYHEVESQNENLLNLYVSGYQLHSTLKEDSVLEVIKEILLNLLGAEVSALWMVDQESGSLEQVMVVDEDDHLKGESPVLSEALTQEMTAGESVYSESGGALSADSPIACVPLQVEGQTVGVLGIFKLLPQKEKGGFSSLDHELLGLLTSQAAPPLIGSRFFGRSGGVLRALRRE